MKKISYFVFIVPLCLFLCACGNMETVSEHTTEPETQTEETDTSVIATTTAVTTEPTETAEPVITVTQTEIQTEMQTEMQTETTVPVTTPTTQPSAQPTTSVPLTMPVTEEINEQNTVSCSFEISCRTILDNESKLKETKKEFLPTDGVILQAVTVCVPNGSTAFDVLKKVCAENICSDGCAFCRENGIQLDFVYTPGYDSYYIRGIHQLYEKDCGSQSGWMYCVNGVFPNYGCSQYMVQDGDTVRFLYTCDLGEDLGNG